MAISTARPPKKLPAAVLASQVSATSACCPKLRKINSPQPLWLILPFAKECLCKLALRFPKSRRMFVPLQTSKCAFQKWGTYAIGLVSPSSSLKQQRVYHCRPFSEGNHKRRKAPNQHLSEAYHDAVGEEAHQMPLAQKLPTEMGLCSFGWSEMGGPEKTNPYWVPMPRMCLAKRLVVNDGRYCARTISLCCFFAPLDQVGGGKPMSLF